MLLNKLIDLLRRLLDRTFDTGPIVVPGIDPGAHAAGDALGGLMEFLVPEIGRLDSAVFIDVDNEGSEVDLVLFNQPFVATTDNAPFAPTLSDIKNMVGTISFSLFKAFNANQASTPTGIGLNFVAPHGKLFGQNVCRGAPTIAADNPPQIELHGSRRWAKET